MESKQAIVFLSPGPTYRPHTELYASQYEELSKMFRGYIFTTGSIGEQFTIGSFTYKSVQYLSSPPLRALYFAVFCIWNSIKLKASGEKVRVVVAYEPFLTGLIGICISVLLGAKMVAEVNGVYTSDAEWMDFPDSIKIRLKRRLYMRIMQLVLKRTDAIKLLFSGQIDSFGHVVPNKVIRHYPCFVPVESFTNIREEKEVLFVGFPFKRKGVDLLIDAFKAVAGKYPDWKLKILGWFPFPNELMNAIGGHPQIYHHKPVPYQEMPSHIGTCGVLVLPSRSEAMGRVLVEAMAAGKARIGARVDGIPTVINDGVDGLLFTPGDSNDLASKLDALLGDPVLRHRLGNASAERVKAEFSKSVYLNNLTNFLATVASADTSDERR